MWYHGSHQIQDSTNKKLIACIGDSLTHGNIGQSWVDYLREEFPNDIFLNEGINANTTWQVLQRLDPILKCKPDLIILKSICLLDLKQKFNCPVYYLIGGIYTNELDKYYYDIKDKKERLNKIENIIRIKILDIF